MVLVSLTKNVPSALSRARGLLVVLAVGTSLATVATLGPASVASGAKTRLEVKVMSSSLGKVLFTTSDMALYTYDRDTKDHSNCNGSCLAAWPALTIAKGLTPSGRGVSGLGVIIRSNGERQVTWKGRPLYRFVSDTKGKVTGNGVAGFAAARLSAKATTTTTAGGYSY
jgi:predicted lipoprotein with Yx(FWY)xxD motif